MNPSTRIVELLKTLANAYPEKKLPRATFQIYLKALADIPLYLLERAISEHIRLSAWFPRVSELRQRALQIAGVRSFEALPASPLDFLRLKEITLTETDTQNGGFDEPAWSALAEKFERCGRHHAAEAIRQRIEFFSRTIPAEMQQLIG